MDQDEYTTGHKYELGMEEGREWATNHASQEQLEQLAEARDTCHAWGFGSENSAFTPGDLLSQVMSGDDPDRGNFAEYVRLSHRKLADDPAFAEGFADGCLEVFNDDEDDDQQ